MQLITPYWKTSKRNISLAKPLIMAILNVTPDSFSDGGTYLSADAALAQAEKMVAEGADLIDIGGESTRPGGQRVSVDEEIRRTAGVVNALSREFSVPISIDTTKYEVALAALENGAEIINDISGLRFDERLGELSASTGAGLVLMHSRGSFEEMHSLPPAADVYADVNADFKRSTAKAAELGLPREQIVLDPGIGFGKSESQNLELINKLDKLVVEYKGYPILIGLSRKSFIGKLLGGVPPQERVTASAVLNAIAAKKGASIVRVHDVKATVDALKALSAVD
jgi:dihydropteroate synthase